jgi:tetratricopeptide (TPR) repeat protein
MAIALSIGSAIAQPVENTKPPARFVPPVLKGIRGDGTPRHANSPIPFPAETESWILARSKHFAFISSANERRTRELAANLETLAAALSRLTPRLAPAPEPTRVIVFSRRREAQPYFDMLLNREAANVSGLFVTEHNSGSMLLNDSDAFSSTRRTPFHELVHYLLSHSDKHPPLWLEEGLAEYFSNAELSSSSIFAGKPVLEHLTTLRHRSLFPLRQLFAVERESDLYNASPGQSVFYAESWAIVDWLVRFGGSDRAVFYAFLADIDNGVAVDVALEQRYHKPVDELSNVIANVAHGSRPMFGFRIDVPTTDATVVTEPLDRAGVLFELGRFLASFEEMAPEAERHFRAALAANPKHARSLAGLAMLRANDKRIAEAVPLFEQAIAADPKDPQVLLDYAEALLDNQIGPLAQTTEPTVEDAPRFRQARALAQRALDAGGDRGRALAALGASYIVEKDSDLTLGIAALEESRRLAPARTDVALHLFSMYRRLDDRAKADPLFAQLEARKEPQVIYASRAIIVRSGLSRANALLHEQKLTEAAALMRALAKESAADPNAASELERQAQDIDGVAQQNREISMYNDAIHQTNARDYAAARKTLDALLKIATDPGVIADARKLQARLARVRR